MKAYLISLAIGLLVGGIYGLLNVRSPAPPVVALLGLFGMLLGEQAVSALRKLHFKDVVGNHLSLADGETIRQ